MAEGFSISQEQRRALKQAALDVARNAHAPYSGFYVGAALLLTSGETVVGCNVENASYRLTCCAEQSAVGRAVSQFGARIKIAAVAVGNLNPSVACMPCGACRQTLLEFATDDCLVLYPGEGGCPQEMLLRDLIPASFRLAH